MEIDAGWASADSVCRFVREDGCAFSRVSIGNTKEFLKYREEHELVGRSNGKVTKLVRVPSTRERI